MGHFWHARGKGCHKKPGWRLAKCGDGVDMRRRRRGSFEFSRNYVGNCGRHIITSPPKAEIPATRADDSRVGTAFASLQLYFKFSTVRTYCQEPVLTSGTAAVGWESSGGVHFRFPPAEPPFLGLRATVGGISSAVRSTYGGRHEEAGKLHSNFIRSVFWHSCSAYQYDHRETWRRCMHAAP